VHLDYPLIGNAVMDVEQFLAAVSAPVDTSVTVQSGDTVLGSDHGEIGTVEEVIEASEETDAYILVRRGLILKQDTYIPLDAVVKRAGTKVFVNVPKLVVGEMPWSAPPSRSDRQAKLGPRGEDV
ncbi:MAG: cysteine hydrolase, partial [Chloroflexota bacterium]|nr:cysteine hydrolase [Chloroflexota bacterium]